MLYQLGAVPYWNSLPLIHYLQEKPRLEVPAALARLLKIGEIDIATAPIVTWFENPHYTLIPEICIGSKGAVRSVKLFFTSPEINPYNVKTIYLDMESRTSALLLKVLLKFKYGRDLNEIQFFHPIPPRHVEAKLLIGDKAMLEMSVAADLDLGHEWTEWTHLPFVFAAWMSRHGEVSEKAIHELKEARDRGIKHVAATIPQKTLLPFDTIKSYLENLNFLLGPSEEKAIMLFKDYLLKGNLLSTSHS